MMGRNERTVPTPGNTPSQTSEMTSGLTSSESNPSRTACVSHSMPSPNKSESGWPTTLKVSQKTTAMMRMNMGIAVYLLIVF